MRNKLLAVVLMFALAVCTLPMQGCSAAWVTTFDNILVAAAPALIDILNIIAIAKGVPVDQTLVTKINTDATTLKALALDLSTASATAAPTVCAQLQAAIAVYSADQAEVLSLAPGVDQATQIKIDALSGLVTGTATAILAVIPSCQAAPSALKAMPRAVPVPLKSFVSSYNAQLVIPTGNAKVDEFTKAHKIHVHSKFVRVVTIGFAD